MTTAPPESSTCVRPHRVRSDVPFYLALGVLGGFYVVMLVGMLVAETLFTSPGDIVAMLRSPDIQYAIKLSLLSTTMSTVLSLWVAVPIGYVMSRYEFPGKSLIDAILDIPIVLPPLVIGLALLILFQQTAFGRFVETRIIDVTFAIPSVILAQVMVACAFAVRTMRVTFDQISPRHEQVALTLGCSRSQAFWTVVLPQSKRGLLTAGTLAWARALGEFGPILVFSGTTRGRTEVLPTSVYLEITAGNIPGAVAVSLLMVFTALVILVLVRMAGGQSLARGI